MQINITRTEAWEEEEKKYHNEYLRGKNIWNMFKDEIVSCMCWARWSKMSTNAPE